MALKNFGCALGCGATSSFLSTSQATWAWPRRSRPGGGFDAVPTLCGAEEAIPHEVARGDLRSELRATLDLARAHGDQQRRLDLLRGHFAKARGHALSVHALEARVRRWLGARAVGG